MQLRDRSGEAPSKATLSRARFKLDILHMMTRRGDWTADTFAHTFVYLGADASLQGGIDWYILQEDAVNVSSPGARSASLRSYAGSLSQSAAARWGFSRRGFSDLIENRSFWGSGRPLVILEPSKKVGGFAPHLFGRF